MSANQSGERREERASQGGGVSTPLPGGDERSESGSANSNSRRASKGSCLTPEEFEAEYKERRAQAIAKLQKPKPDKPFAASIGYELKPRMAEVTKYDGAFSEGAKQALQQMGTNAIPALLKRIVYVQPPFGLRAPEVNIDAVRAFITLGEHAAPAFPQLQALMDGTNQDTALFAMLATVGTGSNAMPILFKGLTNQFPEVRGEAANNLTDGIGKDFPQWRQQAIPIFVKLLNDPNEDVRLSATNQLKEIDPAAAANAGIK